MAQDDFLGVSHVLPFTQWNLKEVGTAGASPTPSLGILQVAWCCLGKGKRSPPGLPYNLSARQTGSVALKTMS